MGQKLKRKDVIFRKIRKFLIWFVIIIIILLVALLLTLELNKENIKHTILTSINDIQSGELFIDDLDFTVFTSFPDLAIVLREATYYEKKSVTQPTQEPPLCRLERLSLGIDLINLLSGQLRISKLLLEDGKINTILYADTSINLIRALQRGRSDSIPAAEGETGLDLHINEITLENIQFSFINQTNGNETDLLIKKFYNGLTIKQDTLFLNFQPEIEIIGGNSRKLELLSGTTLELQANLTLDLRTLSGLLRKSRFSIEGANLDIMGSFDLKDDLYVNLDIASNLTDPSLLLLFFHDEVVRQNLRKIKKGATFVKGRIEGRLLHNIPFIDFSFGISDVDMQVPELNFTLKDLNLEGEFTTGGKQDLSGAVFQITNLSYIGRGGKSQSSLQVENFVNPVINLKINGTFDLSSSEKIFKFIKTPVYSGLMEADINLRVEVDREQGKLRRRSGKTALKVRNLSFLMTNTGKVCDNLDVNIYLDNEGVTIDSLRLTAGQSDLFLQVQSKHLLNYLLGFNFEVDLHATFSSHAFDFKQFLSSDDVGQWILDEYLRNVSGEFWFHSDGERLNKPSELPPGIVKIGNLRLVPENVTSIEIKSGMLNISPEKLDIQNFKANIGSSHVVFSGEIKNYKDLFANEYYDNCLITLDLQAEDFILKDFSTYKNEVYLPEFWAGHQYKNFDLLATLELPATEDSTRKAPFDLHIAVKRLNGINKRTGLVYDNLRLEVTRTGNDLIFTNINGRAGHSKFTNTSLKLVDISNPDSTTRFIGRLTCDRLIIDEWLAHIFYEDTTTRSAPSEIGILTDISEPESYRLPPLDLEAEIGVLQYKTNRMYNLKTSMLKPVSSNFFLDKRDSTWWLPDINLTASIVCDTFRTDYFKVPESRLSLKTVNGLMEFTTSYTGLFGAKGNSLIQMDISQKKHSYRIKYDIADYRVEVFLERLRQDKFLKGIASIHLDVVLLEEDLAKLNGEMTIAGEDLYLFGLDIDEFLTRYKRTQNFNLADIGAFMLAGPIGTVVTKASDYAVLLQLDPKKKSHIKRFISSWSIEAGRIFARDVAFSTDESRIAMKGGFDLIHQEFIDVMLAVVDKKGCELLSQGITGKFDDPQMSSVNVVGTILGPVTNILKLITGNQCEPFYTGTLPPPEE